MTLWREIRGPLFTFVFFVTTMFGMIYGQMGRVTIPKPEAPACRLVTVTYRDGWKRFKREEIQCPGPGTRVWVKHVSNDSNN